MRKEVKRLEAEVRSLKKSNQFLIEYIPQNGEMLERHDTAD